MNLCRIVARNVRGIRAKRGWSQARLGEECNLHRTYIGQIERSEKSIGGENLGRVAGALGVPAARLVTRRGKVEVEVEAERGRRGEGRDSSENLGMTRGVGQA